MRRRSKQRARSPRSRQFARHLALRRSPARFGGMPTDGATAPRCLPLLLARRATEQARHLLLQTVENRLRRGGPCVGLGIRLGLTLGGPWPFGRSRTRGFG